MNNRLELWSLRRQMELIELQMEIYRHKDVYKMIKTQKRITRKPLKILDELRLNLEEKEYNIKRKSDRLPGFKNGLYGFGNIKNK